MVGLGEVVDVAVVDVEESGVGDGLVEGLVVDEADGEGLVSGVRSNAKLFDSAVRV